MCWVPYRGRDLNRRMPSARFAGLDARLEPDAACCDLALALDLGEVACELEADADVVLHAADLSAEGDAVFLERIFRLLVLVGVDLHLLAEARAKDGRVLGDEGSADVDAALLEHEDDKLAHSVLDGVGREDADAVVLSVDVEAAVLDGVAQGALVVLGLESEVALDDDVDVAGGVARGASEGVDVVDDELELAGGICAGTRHV